jgi:CBS domain-containing protein
MEREGIHAIPIVSRTGPSPDAETIIQGIITSTDLCKVNDDNIVVEDILSPSVVHVIHGNTGVRSAAKMMLKHKVHHIVVMDDGKIVGMISSLDFVTLIANNALGKKKDRVI